MSVNRTKAEAPVPVLIGGRLDRDRERTRRRKRTAIDRGLYRGRELFHRIISAGSDLDHSRRAVVDRQREGIVSARGNDTVGNTERIYRPVRAVRVGRGVVKGLAQGQRTICRRLCGRAVCWRCVHNHRRGQTIARRP